MKPSPLATLAAAAVVLTAPLAAQAALSPYSQNFEGLDKQYSGALADDGWKRFANVFSGSSYLYGYGGTVPNGGNGYSALVDDQGGPAQGKLQLSVYNDYGNNGAHGAGQWVEALVFQERQLAAGDAGQWHFEFDGKRGNLASPTTAYAFIKTLNPAANWATTNFVQVDMTAIPDTWNRYSLSFAVDSSLSGQVLQFGFANKATRYAGSGVFYDNINFATAPVPEPSTYALMFAGLGLVGAVARRRAAGTRR